MPKTAAVTNVSVENLQKQYERMLRTSRTTTNINPLIADLDIVVNEIKKNEERTRLKVDVSSTSLYSPAVAPVVIIHGPGKVGQKLYDIAKSFGKSAFFQFIEAEQLSVMREPDLEYLLRDVKSVIIAADGKDITKTRWLGKIETQEANPVLNFKGLQKLLNYVASEAERKQHLVKIIALGKACQPRKALGSFLLGDTTDFESEIILECKQRNLAYNIIKVGRVIGEDEPIFASVKYRGVNKQSLQPPTGQEKGARTIPESPIVFTFSPIIESTECTRVNVAAEALLRATTHPHRNVTVSLLSSQLVSRPPTDIEWNDEFVKLDGPELRRLPLRFTSYRQAALLLKGLVRALQEGSKQLVTPIQIEEYSNAVKIIFKPLVSSYVSAKEEREQAVEKAKSQPAISSSTANMIKPKRQGGYLSPEQEKGLQTPPVVAEQQMTAKTKKNVQTKRKNEEPEGGLEVVLEEQPYLRLRVRRTKIGPKTVVKEESEKFILSLIEKSWISLENDMKIMLSKYST